MKFSQMEYRRPDVDQVMKDFKQLTEEFISADSFEKALDVFFRIDTLKRHISTQSTLCSIRYSINTKDPFYKEESAFWDEFGPRMQGCMEEYDKALLSSPFRPQLEEKFGDAFFRNQELSIKAFRQELIPLMQQENQLANEYETLLASAAIPFEGGTYTLSQLEPFMNDPDDERRERAWKANGQWFKDNQQKFDSIYDQLVKLRDQMGRMMGYDGYTELGYCRMLRTCYDRKDVETFREAVVKYIVPIDEQIYRLQAERLNKSYPLSFADVNMSFRSGNPKPVGNEQEILAQGRKFYDELSPETSAFFNMMLDNELLDVTSSDGKQSGGYCTEIADYRVPFIFANFNGTQGDIDVITHEAGHAFEAYLNIDRVPMETIFPSMEAAEVHSMSMEFFAWNWLDGFFGKDAAKYRYAHLSGALQFIPYGCTVDHFQHIVYDNPDMTPAERHQTWKKLLGTYMPWLRLDGVIPFYGEGMDWQMKHHIYSSPFYYIDYCLAQTVALQMWGLIQKDKDEAWKTYMKYTKLGGSMVFTDLLKEAGLRSPFDPQCLKEVAEEAQQWLSANSEGLE